MNSIVQTVYSLALPVAQELGLSIWDVEYKKEGSEWYLRVFIDKPEGVSLEDCEKFSRAFDSLLDEKDPVPNFYYFEVSSPGIGRTLKTKEHFEQYIGARIELHFYKPVDNSKKYAGILKSYDGTKILVDDREFLLKDITKANLYEEI